jgi:hypothetical protein
MVEILHRRSTQIRANPDALRIVINYWLGWPVFAFMVVWTGFSGYHAYIDWVRASTDSTIYIERAFSILGIGMMSWLIFGHETITFHEQSIKAFRGMCGIGWYYSFFIGDVHDVRVGCFLDPHARGKWEPRFVRASLVFEYRGKTQRLGNELGELEAQRIVKAIREWNPQLVYAPTDVATETFHDKPRKARTEFRTTTTGGPNPIVLLLFGLWIIWGFGFDTVGRRLEVQLDGVVTSSRDIPTTRGPRFATEYTLRGPDGQDHIYVAGFTDASLPRSMPVGTYLKKQRWHLDYERNRRHVDDFPIFFYQVMLGIALGCVVWSVILWHGQRQAT